jgi:tellurite resistance protein
LGAIRYLTEGELGARAADHMIVELQAALERDGIEVRLDEVASRVCGEPEDRELALSLAAAAAMADGHAGPTEESAVVGLAERLGFSESRLKAMLVDDD